MTRRTPSAIPLSPYLLAGCLLTGFAAAETVPPAAASFDGSWSVSIVTERGNCDSYRYEVTVRAGRVSLRESGPAELAGTVTSGGAVKVSVQRGAQRADGTGRLARDTGAGSWRGQSSTETCSGRWSAERR